MTVELIAVTPEPERVIERAARTCYQSHGRAATDPGRLISRLIEMGHESPLEHAYATFRLAGVSRAMSHQLVRHRLMAVSQKSQRYVSEDGFTYVIPPAITSADADAFAHDMATIRAMYARWKDSGIRNEDARFVLPQACATELVISANFREFRHVIQVRCTPHAQWEIREVCTRIRDALMRHAPNVFRDLA